VIKAEKECFSCIFSRNTTKLSGSCHMFLFIESQLSLFSCRIEVRNHPSWGYTREGGVLGINLFIWIFFSNLLGFLRKKYQPIFNRKISGYAPDVHY